MKLATCLLIHTVTLSALAADILVTIPDNLPFGEGNSSGWPFTFVDLGITSRRYQQVYAASEFASLGTDGGYIKELWFREDMPPSQLANDFLDSVQINFGITARSPDGLSPFFSENVGNVYSIAYGPSPLHVSTLTGWALITLTQPFFYTPASGNLLLDIRTTDDTPTLTARRTLDAHEIIGDSISAVMANDVNASSGFLTTKGLVTQFRIEPIPEPSTWVLLGLGLFGIWRFYVRRNNS